MAALLQQGARRIGGSVLQRTQVAKERRLLVPRRMYSTHEEIKRDIERRLEEELRARVKLMKPHQIYWELIKRFPVREFAKFVVGTTVLVTIASASREVNIASASREVKEAKKKEQQ